MRYLSATLTLAVLTIASTSSCLRTGLAPWYETSHEDGGHDSSISPDADADVDVDTDADVDANADSDSPVDTDDAFDAGWGDVVWVYFVPGTGLSDALGRGPTGTCASCPEEVITDDGSAWDFDGTDAVDIVDDGTIDWSAGFTVAAFVLLRDVSEFRCFFMKIYGDGYLNTFKLAIRPDLDFETTESGAVDRMRSGVNLATDVWIHLAITWDGTTKRLFVDGVEVDSEVAPAVDNDGSVIVIGADRDSGEEKEWLEGLMRELRFYDRPLSDAEIVDLVD